jgi:hypothetical protein
MHKRTLIALCLLILALPALTGCGGMRRVVGAPIDAVLEEGARFAETVLAPLNASRRRRGLPLRQGHGAVRTPTGFKPRPTRSSSKAAGAGLTRPRVRRPGPAAHPGRRCRSRR